jgi:hypothetical protein
MGLIPLDLKNRREKGSDNAVDVCCRCPDRYQRIHIRRPVARGSDSACIKLPSYPELHRRREQELEEKDRLLRQLDQPRKAEGVPLHNNKDWNSQDRAGYHLPL